MDLIALRTFFKWCTIINGGYLVLASLILVFAGDWVFRLHGRWFPLTREAFSAVIYGFLGFLKIIVIAFNLTPYLVLLIMT